MTSAAVSRVAIVARQCHVLAMEEILLIKKKKLLRYAYVARS